MPPASPAFGALPLDKNPSPILLRGLPKQPLRSWPDGHIEGVFEGLRFGVTLHRSGDGRRLWLYGEERGGGDVVSANLYALGSGEVLLKPCEMPAAVVARFILGFVPDRSE